MAHLEYSGSKVHSLGNHFDYSDSYLSFKGHLLDVNLYDINSSQEVSEKLSAPALAIFREN